jgi:hypothetical protein
MGETPAAGQAKIKCPSRAIALLPRRAKKKPPRTERRQIEADSAYFAGPK